MFRGAELVKLSIILFRADEILPWAREGLFTPVRGLPEPPMFPARAERRVVLRPLEVGPLGVVVVGLALALLRLAGLRSTSTASSLTGSASTFFSASGCLNFALCSGFFW